MKQRKAVASRKASLGLITLGSLLLSILTLSPVAIYADDPEDRVRQTLENSVNGGTVGLYLKEVGGPVLADHNEAFIFEPASTIKALIHFHAVKQVQDEAMIDGEEVTLDRQIKWFMDQTGSCPDLTTEAFDTLENGLTEMMVPSDNRWTQALRDFFGDTNIDATRQALDMSDTKLQHLIGCAGDALANPNQLTLVDAGKLYESVATGFLDPTSRAKAYEIMIDNTAMDPREQFAKNILIGIVDDEEQAIGLPSATFDKFKEDLKFAAKAGGYTLNSKEFRSVAGWAEIPFLDNSCQIDPQQYVFGAFMHNADSLITDDIWTPGLELLREQIRAALESQAACEADVQVTSMTIVDPPEEIDVNTPLQITLRKAVRNNGPASTVDAEVTRMASAPEDCKVTPESDSESLLGLMEGDVVVVEEEFVVECSQPSSHTFTFDNEIALLDPDMNDPDPDNNDATTSLTVDVIAQADLAIVGWDFSALENVEIDDLLVGQSFFFPTTKTVHNFGDTVANLYSTPADANVWKTLIIPEGIRGSVHVSVDEAPADIVIEKPNELPIELNNQPAGTVVDVEGPAELSVHFMAPDLQVSVDRDVIEEFDIECLEPSLHEVKFVNEIMAKDLHIQDPDPSNNTLEVVHIVECVTPVQINIRPGNAHNFINPDSEQTVPVAILTTEPGEYGLPISFDASAVDPASVRFGTKSTLQEGGGAMASPNMGFIKDSHELDDKTKDGDSDMMLLFETTEAGFDQQSTEACMVGTYLGEDNQLHKFFGCDMVQVQ
jgi:hypothetical protein